jgi:hypothetical protein
MQNPNAESWSTHGELQTELKSLDLDDKTEHSSMV